jgi:hypothetical protein
MDRPARHLPVVALITAAVVLPIFALAKAPWLSYELSGERIVLTFREWADLEPGALPLIMSAVLTLASVYFCARLGAAGLLVLIDGPTSTRRVAWLSPHGASLQCHLVLALGVVVLVLMETNKAVSALGAGLSWGGFVYIAGIVLARLSIHLVARDPDLARTQAWTVDLDALPDPRAAQPARRERPMIDPPLPSPPRVDGDPFRSPPVVELSSKVVETAAPAAPAPIRHDEDAEQPRILR